MIKKFLENRETNKRTRRFKLGFNWCQRAHTEENISLSSIRKTIERSPEFDSFDEGALAALRLYENTRSAPSRT